MTDSMCVSQAPNERIKATVDYYTDIALRSCAQYVEDLEREGITKLRKGADLELRVMADQAPDSKK